MSANASAVIYAGATKREDDNWDAALVQWLWEEQRGIWRGEKLLAAWAVDLVDFSEWYCKEGRRC